MLRIESPLGTTGGAWPWLIVVMLTTGGASCGRESAPEPIPPPERVGPEEKHGAWELEPPPPEGDGMQAVHATLLPNGKVLIVNGSSLRIDRFHRRFGRKSWREPDGADAATTDNTALFDPGAPAGERFRRIASPENPFEGEANDLFCAGQLHTPEGDVLFVGGTRRSFRKPIALLASRIVPAYAGTRVANLFDWRSETWSKAWTLEDGHWYPSLLALADGRLAAISGIGYGLRSPNSPWVEIYDSKSESWDSVDVSWRRGGSGSYGGAGPAYLAGASSAAGLENSPFGAPIDDCDDSDDCHDWMDHYPRIHSLPDGRFLISGDGSGGGNVNSRQTYFMTVAPAAGYGADPDISFERGPQREGPRRTYSSAVEDPSSPGGFLLFGGKLAGKGPLTQPPSGFRKAPDRTVTADMERYVAPAPGEPQGRWEVISGFMGPEPTDGRVNHFAILLPTKQILIVGGGLYRFYEPHHHPLLLTPSASAKGGYERQRMNPSHLPRLYHTTALLLPDGRVLVAGGNASMAVREIQRDGTVEVRLDTEMRRGLPPIRFVDSGSPAPPAEIHQIETFSPPYLFLPGPRPEIRSAPEALVYGRTHSLEVEHATPGASLVLIKLGSSTHGWDMGQRLVDLELGDEKAESGNVTFQAPADGQAAAPGYYMLFYVDAEGRPSVAPIVCLGGEGDCAEA